MASVSVALDLANDTAFNRNNVIQVISVRYSKNKVDRINSRSMDPPYERSVVARVCV